jgi:hypothetical protein
LKTHWDGRDCESYFSFGQTHIFVKMILMKRKKEKFVFGGEDEEMKREEIESQSLNLKHILPALKIMNDEDQAKKARSSIEIAHTYNHIKLYISMLSLL